MASYGSIASATDSDGSVTVTKPASLAAGDLMVAICSESGLSGTFATPSGWTLVDAHDASTHHTDVFAKVADSSDASASDFTFTHASSGKVEAVLYRITGTFASASNIYAISSDTPTEAVSDTLRSAVGITPTVASSLLIMYFRAQCTDSDNNTIAAYAVQTSNPTWTERAEIQDNGGTNEIRIGTATATRTEVTDTGYFEATVSTGPVSPTQSIGILLAIADTQNGTPTIAVVTSALAVQSPTVAGGAQTSPSVVTMASSMNAPTVTGATNDALWKNTDKPSPGSISNTDKP